MRAIDLNADLGEGAGADAELLALVSSASIACGGHAGDRGTMHDTVSRAAELGVTIGAHPSYPDRASFGRREIGAIASQIETWIEDQVGELRDVCDRAGTRLAYVKPHGALYNRAVKDSEAAAAIVSAVAAIDRNLAILALAESRLIQQATAAALRVAREAFPDRAYARDGSLVPRGDPGAVISDRQVVTTRALSIAIDGLVTAADDGVITVRADSLCIHGDSPAAAESARAVRAGLETSGVLIAPFA